MMEAASTSEKMNTWTAIIKQTNRPFYAEAETGLFEKKWREITSKDIDLFFLD
jgi:hypothetical protein